MQALEKTADTDTEGRLGAAFAKKAGGMRMKAGRYGKGFKILAVVLQLLFLTASVVSAALVNMNAAVRISDRRHTGDHVYYISPFSGKEAFEDSEIFETMLRDSLDEVIRYGVIRGQLETDGVFDETKPVDIEQYARHFEELPVTDTSVCYRLGDLIRWGQSGFSLEDHSYEEAEQMIAQAHAEDGDPLDWEYGEEDEAYPAGRQVTVMDSRSADAQAEAGAGAPLEIVGGPMQSKTAQETIEEPETAQAQGGEASVSLPVERYRPEDGRSLLGHVKDVEELEEMVSYLWETVRMLQENYASYREYQAYYDGGSGNLRYAILRQENGRAQLYTNVPSLQKNEVAGGSVTAQQAEPDSASVERQAADAVRDVQAQGGVSAARQEEIGRYFQGVGKYLYFAPDAFAYQSNTAIPEESVRRIWNEYLYAYPDQTAVWLGVDTAFPSNDIFREAWESYQLALPGYQLLLFAGVCALLAFLLLIAASLMAGRKKGSEETVCIWFDSWYTEISAVCGCLVCGGLFGATGIAVSELMERGGSVEEILTALGAGVFLTGAAFLFFWLSLIRRIRAKRFWKGFLLYRICLKGRNLVMGFYDDSRSAVRVWTPYLLFVAANLLLIELADGGDFGAGAALALVLDIPVGVFLYRNGRIRKRILDGIGKIRGGDLDYQIDTKKMHGDNLLLAEAVNSIGNGIRRAVETSLRDERMKADLITNVSHDIKTPLTSIINYVDLLKREPVENEKVRSYLEILDMKSQRLKQLTEDLVEVSRISSGNIVLQCERLDLVELMQQTIGEFQERFEKRGLRLIVAMEERPLFIYADSRRIWRVAENLFNNVCKYALEQTRVYVETRRIHEENGPDRVKLSIKNISAQPLTVGVEELTERFIRGDASRTTEGSGLGLSIAKSLTELQKGSFEIVSDGDLFKVMLTFSLVENEKGGDS